MISKNSLKRFYQEGSDCAVCASATVANYFNKNIDFQTAKEEALKIDKSYMKGGLTISQICYLLNNLGIKKVTLVSTDLVHLDFSWSKLSKKELIKNIKEVYKKGNLDISYKAECLWLLKFLRRRKFNNKLLINKNFTEHIKKSLDKGNPVIGVINWTLFFEATKTDLRLNPKPINGITESHAVVIYKYTSDGVYVLDSREYDNDTLKIQKIANYGDYFISWGNLGYALSNREFITVN
jgi:hypothetical protein